MLKPPTFIRSVRVRSLLALYTITLYVVFVCVCVLRLFHFLYDFGYSSKAKIHKATEKRAAVIC